MSPRKRFQNALNLFPAEMLVEELCGELRYLWRDLSEDDGRPVDADGIRNVVALADALTQLGFDLAKLVDEMSQTEDVQITAFIESCRQFPEQVPCPRHLDGIRLQHRCHRCKAREHAPGTLLLYYCQPCLDDVLYALESRTPAEDIELFRTYNSECRCSHANNDTVLVLSPYFDGVMGYCAVCVESNQNSH